MKLRSVSIAARLGTGFAIVLSLLAMVAAASALLVNDNRNMLKTGLGKANLKSELVVNMKSSLLQSGVAMRNMLDISTVDKQKARVDVQRKLYAEALAGLLQTNLSKEEKQILSALESMEKQIEPQYRIAIRQAENMNAEGAASVITKYIDPMNSRSVGEIDKLLEIQRRAAHGVMRQAEKADADLLNLLLGITLLAVFVGALISWRITRSIIVPLNQAVQLACSVASGDLTARISDPHHDEIGRLLKALETMNQSLHGIIGKVRNTTDVIGTDAQELASGNMDLSVRTEAQAAAVEETASAMEELTSTVRQNVDNARAANQLVKSACGIAMQGGQVVDDVVSTMTSISQSSRRIFDIIGVIDGIAFQTNILALNAAVEAARAGGQGRGFAVVASEVRSLAHRSAVAAKEIKELIDDSMSKVTAGTALVNRAGSTMDEVVGSVKRVNAIMAEIAAASEEQSAGIEQVNKAISQIDRVTQENASLVEAAASAARRMQKRAGELAGAVGVFRCNAVFEYCSDGPAVPEHAIVTVERRPDRRARRRNALPNTSPIRDARAIGPTI